MDKSDWIKGIVKEKYVIQENKNMFRIRWIENRQQKEKCIRFGKRKTKDGAYQFTKKEKEKLEN